ncbi:uncharacterized protein [Struthio camelus]|uniref:uncharacterized protein n=1 Tax=Struthio camelus TaxID=8801 RepID=UPI003603B33E
MEPMLTAAAVEAGPVYFFDQMKTRVRERDKKIPEELSSYFSFPTTDLQPLSCTPSLIKGKNPGCAGEHTERHEDGFINDDPSRKENYSVLHPMSCHSLCKTTTEDTKTKVSQIPSVQQAEEDSPLNILNKCVAANMLQELGEKLQPFASYETGFPQGLVNMLACNWRELTEGTDCNKWHQKSLAYESVRSRRRQASEEAKNGAPGSKCMQHEIPAIRKDQHKRNFALSACATKEKRNAETASNTPLGSKAPVVQNHTSQSPVAISFSLSSKICEERGWIFQPSDSNAEDLPYVRALKRLQQIQKQIKEQVSEQKEAGFGKPIILRHYGDPREENFLKTWKGQTGMTVTPALLYGKPQIPMAKKTDPPQRKLHYGLNDGSSLI